MAPVLLITVYIIGLLFGSVVVYQHAHDKETATTKWDQPWVPGVTRRDACAMPFFPVFFFLPALLWPLVVAAWVLILVAAGLWVTLGSATSCCGIKLPAAARGGEEQRAEGGSGGDDGEAPPDLEMGAVDSGGDDGSPDDAASVRSAASAGSECPPSYDTLEPREDGGGETDGLLGRGTK